MIDGTVTDIPTDRASQPGSLALVQSFAPEPYDVLKPLHVVVRPTADEDEFVAGFHDANLSAHGANEAEAVENLKVLMLDVFDNLGSKPPAKLGPGPKRQLAVLGEFIRKRV